MSRLYDVTVTVTYEARLRADSKQDAEGLAVALSGAYPFDQTDIQVEVHPASDGVEPPPATFMMTSSLLAES